MNHRFFFMGLLGLIGIGRVKAQNGGAILASEYYKLYPDSICQPPFRVVAVSDSELRSDYRSPGNPYRSSKISFKFGLNGQDNEMVSGSDDHFLYKRFLDSTPLLRFGEQFQDTATTAPLYIPFGARLKVRLDMRKVLAEFKSKGYYTLYNGQRFYQKDFKGVYIAGDAAPLTWDFTRLGGRDDLRLDDADSDGIFEKELELNKPAGGAGAAGSSGAAGAGGAGSVSTWKLSRDVSAYPRYHSSAPIADAIYNLALEEMTKAIEADSTFRTGKLWAGVWTRDISYSIILGMAYLQPRVAMRSLMRKVNARKRIIQDTGTGGAYPVSSDRMIWAVAAWEVYLATGEDEWLRQAYGIIRNSMEDDLLNCYDRETGLVRGESSFLDWREQSYPGWMQPVDIYSSENLGTNAVHYEANLVLSRMASLLHDEAGVRKYDSVALCIKKGVNAQLWQEDRGLYAQYLYGRNYKIVSPRAEALGEALCVLFGLADRGRAEKIVAQEPITAYGIPCIYPEIPGIPPYHNDAVWPFVESFWAQASVAADNEMSVLEAIGAVYRAAGLFLTNKENFVVGSGDFAGTQINSDNMLWSLSGNISLVHKVLFGIAFQPAALVFHPFVPRAMGGLRTLTNFRYRAAVLDISVEGWGDSVKACFVDGRQVVRALVASGIVGRHRVRIVMADRMGADAGRVGAAAAVKLVRDSFSLAAPMVSYSAGQLDWPPVQGAARYQVLRNGVGIASPSSRADTRMAVTDSGYAEWQVVAIDSSGVGSFASEPVGLGGVLRQYQVEDFAARSGLPYNGYTGKGFVEISSTVNRELSLSVDIGVSGFYAVDLRYANGNGPINTSNKCAIRTLREKDVFLGTVVMPQRGEDWGNWGFSNPIRIYLTRGRHLLRLLFEPQNENMNGEVNQAMLDYLRVVKLK